MRWLAMCLSMVSTMVVAESSPVAIALHGGAGTIERGKMSAELEATYRVFLEAAITDGHRQLEAGHPGLDVVVTVIQKMEDSPHVMLAAKGAEAFARAQGIESVDPDYFGTERRRKALEAYKADEYAGVEPEADYKFGTVGVVVLDKAGNLVAGTSTGGMTGKRWGRVGDSPIIGAGTYADNRSCAVSATGHGEFFIRHTVARDICARMQFGGASLHDATAQVVLKALVAAGGEGGVAAVDHAGNVALTFNTPGMYRASINATGEKTVGIFGDDQ